MNKITENTMDLNNDIPESKWKSFFDNLLEKTVLVQFICSFISILATISITLLYIFVKIDMPRTLADIIGVILIILYIIGMGSAIISCPLKLISTPIRWAIKGFQIGLFIPFAGPLLGGVSGLVFGVVAIVYCPAIITIPNNLLK